MILTQSQVAYYLNNAGFTGTALNYAVQICKCESNFNTLAHNIAGEDSRGLMQINVAPNANPQYSNFDLFDAQVNCMVAFEIFTNRNNSFRDWTCARILGLETPGATNQIIALAGLAIIGGIVLYYA